MLYERLKDELQTRFKDLHIKAGAIVCGIVVITLLIYFLHPDKKTTRILFFPKTNYSAEAKEPVLHSEQRTLPKLATREENIRLMIQELLLGPIHPQLTAFCSKATKLVRLFVKDNDLYIDLSTEVLESSTTKQPLTIKDKLEILKKNIFFNFHSVKKVHIFLNGQLPQF